ncbi:MAG: hypothetical protein EOO86_05060 [Pedobacter sp.]|nr:MAG: hypothetical protein EOO86_05060 [Pedobacter sp.]
MRIILLMLAICLTISCKKDLDKKLTSKEWKIESTSVTPAITIGSKSSTNYLELMGSASCEATTTLYFSEEGVFSSSANGALCDLFYNPNSKPIIWTREENQIKISSQPNSPYILNGNKLTQTTTTASGGIVYTFVRVYKAK